MIDAETWLIAGAALSFAAAVLHLCCIAGGSAWYRAVGAGERMVGLVERGSLRPHIVALGIAAVLLLWAAYALSGAGVIPRLPLLRTGLILITSAYLARAAAYPLLIKIMPDRSPAFLRWSSMIVFGIGGVHLIGLAFGWTTLAG